MTARDFENMGRQRGEWNEPAAALPSNPQSIERWDLTEGSQLRTSATIRNTGTWVRYDDIKHLLAAAETTAEGPYAFAVECSGCKRNLLLGLRRGSYVFGVKCVCGVTTDTDYSKLRAQLPATDPPWDQDPENPAVQCRGAQKTSGAPDENNA